MDKDIFHVFIGDDEERLKEILEELEKKTNVLWMNELPVSSILNIYEPKVVNNLYFNEDIYVAGDTPVPSIELTPEEFIKRIREIYPKETDWSKVPKGTLVAVKDYWSDEWLTREFVLYDPELDHPFVVRGSNNMCADSYHECKLIYKTDIEKYAKED